MKTGRYNIKQLLTNPEVEQIIIPEIQRDYVWKKQNVLGLLKSICDHYTQKKTLSLDIKCNGKELPEDIHNYLTDEYLRIRFNTHVGFIYAYHDPTYSGKLFLIDGQQRITTMSLLLLAVYCKDSDQDSKDAYRKEYFKNSLPKLDYKVRETAHDFIVSFIDFALSHENTNFKQSSEYYDIYSKDVTANSILENYQTILKFIDDNQILENRKSFLDYLENYIEFNYFDTNLSEQGERLYLYMNSRGEELSEQENVKALLIEKSSQKLADSELWENWQNFFWAKRGQNPNADKGFESFLAMSAIIHLCTQTEKSSSDKEKYIKSLIESNFIRTYIEDNSSFDISWLKSIFQAIEKLASRNGISDGYLRAGWLENIKYMIDYVTILGCTYYLMLYPDAIELEVKRIGMHLKNICFYSNNSKNPINAIIVSLESLKKMGDSKVRDIADCKLPEISINFISDSDKEIAQLYKQNQRIDWEKVFWNVINYNENHFNSFIQGNLSILLHLCVKELSPNELENTFKLFVDRIYQIEKNDDWTKKNELRRKLLEYGDYSLPDGGGSASLGPWMERWNFIEDGDDWMSLFTAWKNQDTENKFNILKNYVNNESTDFTNKHDWISFLRNPKYECFGFMGQRKFLWWEGENGLCPHVILLSGHQASEFSSRELAIQILDKLLKPAHWIWNYNTCVIDFKLHDNSYVTVKPDDKKFYLDIVYHWSEEKPFWGLRLGHRTDELGIDILNKLNSNTKYKWSCSEEENNKRKFIVERFYEYNKGDTDETAAQEIQSKVEKLLEEICTTLG